MGDPANRRARRRAARPGPAATLWTLLVASCAAEPPPVSPEQVARAAAELLRPFAVERNVVADRVDVVLTQNFYSLLVLPGLTPERSESADGDDVYVYRGDLRQPLAFAIEATRFTIVDRLRIVVRGVDSELQLDALASGVVTVLGTDGQRQDLDELRIERGEVQP